MAKKLLKTVLVILGIILLAAAALILWLSVTEFKPGTALMYGSSFTVLSVPSTPGYRKSPYP